MAPSTAKNKILAAQRLDQIRAMLHDDRVVRVDELCQQLAVSPATVRRDLEELERFGEARRVHGGAVLENRRLEEPLFDDRAVIAPKEKRRIAEAALALIQPDDTIYLDGGSTVLALASLLREHGGVTVVTNSLRAAWELAGKGPRVILTGGELRRLSQTMVGTLTRHLLSELHIDKAFMGTLGMTLDEGLTTTDPGEAYTKELVMGRAREVVLMADSEKAGKVKFSRAGSFEDVNVLVTNKEIDPAFVRAVEKMGVRVISA